MKVEEAMKNINISRYGSSLDKPIDFHNIFEESIGNCHETQHIINMHGDSSGTTLKLKQLNDTMGILATHALFIQQRLQDMSEQILTLTAETLDNEDRQKEESKKPYKKEYYEEEHDSYSDIFEAVKNIRVTFNESFVRHPESDYYGYHLIKRTTKNGEPYLDAFYMEGDEYTKVSLRLRLLRMLGKSELLRVSDVPKSIDVFFRPDARKRIEVMAIRG